MDMSSSVTEACQRNMIWDTVEQSARASAETVALRIIDATGQESSPITYAGLLDGGLAAAALLDSLGVAEGSIVFTAVANTGASVALSLGIARLAAVWAPADSDLTVEQIARLCDVYEPVAAFLMDDKVDTLSASGHIGDKVRVLKMPSWDALLACRCSRLLAESPIADEAPAVMLLTSGTTGLPKSVMTPTSSLRKWVRFFDVSSEASQQEAVVYFGSPAWISYFVISLTAFRGKQCFVLGQGYTKDFYFDAVLRHRPSFLFFWPEVVVDFVRLPAEQQQRIASFATSVMYGGARTPPSAVLKLIRALPNTAIAQGYASTEFGSVSWLTAEDHAAARQDPIDERILRRLASAGRCIRQVRIVDDEARPVPVGEVGSIQLLPAAEAPGSSQTNFMGYYKNSAATKAKRTADGWFITGDLGRLDEDGYLYLDGRDSETIVLLSGDNVYPNEVESAIAELPDVIEVAVAKVVAGESSISEVGAFVRVTEEAQVTVQDVKEQCRRSLGQAWSHPTHIFIQTEKLPRNRNGKCMKSLLTAKASASLKTCAPVGGA